MYEHIVWTLEDTTCDVKKIMGTDIVRKINKDKELLMQNGFSFGYEELTVNNLQDFVDQVYVPVIGQRKNQRVERILTVLTPEEIQTHKRQFIFIRQGDKLLGGGICRENGGSIAFGYKANIKDSLGLKAGFGTLIDYLFFSLGIERHITNFRYGKDRNGYGMLGALPSVGLHKLYLGFIPQLEKKKTIISFSPDDIEVPTLIFSNPDENGIFTSALIFHNDGSINEPLLEKRGFTIIHD